MITDILEIAALRNGLLMEGVNAVTMKRVDAILDYFLVQINRRTTRSFVGLDVGNSGFHGFFQGLCVKGRVILNSRTTEEGSIYYQFYNTKTWSLGEAFLENLPLRDLTVNGNVDESFILANPGKDYLLRKPRIGDTVASLRDINIKYVVSNITNDYMDVIRNGQNEVILTNEVIVLEEGAVILKYEVTDTYPESSKLTNNTFTTFKYPVNQVHSVEGAIRTIKVVKVEPKSQKGKK